MNPASILGKTVLVAVFLAVLGCSGGDDNFVPARGSTVEEGELEALIGAAVAGYELEWKNAQLETLQESRDGRPSCFQVESGPCHVPRPPRLSVVLQGNEGMDVFVSVGIGIDSLEAGDRVNSAIVSRSHAATGTLRLLYLTPELIDGLASGPCDYKADRESDDGCAWQERDAPSVGAEARAMKSETLEDIAFSAVAFARGNLFANVEVVRRGDSDAPNGLADDIAKALDEQIKVALSQ